MTFRNAVQWRSVTTSSLVGRARRLPYGWIIVAVLCITETVTWGIIYYGFPVFLRSRARSRWGSASPRCRRCRWGDGSTVTGRARS
jgi:hypothetical protein